MKAKPFKGTAVPVLAGKGPTYEITRAQLVALIASRLSRRTGDDNTTVCNRVSSKVNYDVAHKKLRRDASGRFRSSDVADWAEKNWPGLFAGLFPTRTSSGALSARLPAATLSASGYTVPLSLAAAHADLHAMHQRLTVCTQALEAARVEIAALAPKAARWDHFMATRPSKAKGMSSQ